MIRSSNAENFQRVSQLGGFENLLDFILSTFFYTKDKPIAEPQNQLDSFSSELNTLFAVLLNICKQAFDLTLTDKIHRTVISVLLNIFNVELRQNERNTKARNYLL